MCEAESILKECTDDEIMIWSSPALQDLTIEDVIGWYGGDRPHPVCSKIRENILSDSGEMRLSYVNMAYEALKASRLLVEDPQGRAIVLLRISLVQTFWDKACE